mmetsp:Transcript_25401/g.54172  ORF Transcript_25401/g.54172 Transcript_25401/m.54172 type:complete len:242 (-) Transcript_25401:611-1336(-)
MRLFHLVEQQDRVRLATNGIRELSSFVVSDVTGWCTQQSCNGVLFHVFGHVDSNNSILGIEHEFTECLTKFRLSYSGWTQKNQGGNGLGRIVESGSRTLHGLGDNLYGFALPDNTITQPVTHRQDASPFAFKKLCWWDTRPNSDHVRDVIGNHFVTEHAIFVVAGALLFRNLFQRYEFFLEGWKFGILELGGFIEVEFTLALFDFEHDAGNFGLDILDAIDATLLGHPFQVQCLLLVFEVD